MNNLLRYILSFFPLLLVLLSSSPELAIVFVILPILPVLGTFYRQLHFYDGVAASFGWIFLSFLLPFETISVLAIHLIIFWGVLGVFFIQRKEVQIRQLERISFLVNYMGKEKPIKDWAYMPLSKLQYWATMVEGVRKKPFPVRILLFKDPNIKLRGGQYYDIWYEAVVLLNQDLLNKLPPLAQIALAAKEFAHLLNRNSDNLKNLIFWLGLLISWSYATVIQLDPAVQSLDLINNFLISSLMIGLGLTAGYLILVYQLRQQEYQADLRAADLTSLNDIHTVYEYEIKNRIHTKQPKRIISIMKHFLSPNPSPEEHMHFLIKIADEHKSDPNKFVL